MPGKTRRNQFAECCSLWCFNEAPAKCRGKHPGCPSDLEQAAGFNEAPAKCRGKRGRNYRTNQQEKRFNEAPAKCRGKLIMSGSAPSRPSKLQ